MDQSNATNAASQRNQYMEVVTALFEEDLVAAYEKDSSAEMLKQLTASLEIGAAVWGAPLLVDTRRMVAGNSSTAPKEAPPANQPSAATSKR